MYCVSVRLQDWYDGEEDEAGPFRDMRRYATIEVARKRRPIIHHTCGDPNPAWDLEFLNRKKK